MAHDKTSLRLRLVRRPVTRRTGPQANFRATRAEFKSSPVSQLPVSAPSHQFAAAGWWNGRRAPGALAGLLCGTDFMGPPNATQEP
jgi:hypothetical protein